MAILEQIRVKLGILISVLIAIALLSFIIDPNTLSSTMQMVSNKNKVGSMNGKSISYQDFYAEYDRTQKLYEALGQSVNSEEGQEQVRNAAWQNYFDKYIFLPKVEAAGINVGKEEMYDLFQGNNISPILANQSAFLDENGNFSRTAFSEFVSTMGSDETGIASAYYDYLEKTVKNQQYYNKYAAMIMNSSTLSALEINKAIEAGNITSDVDFIMMPIGYVQDSTISVTDQEIKAYYDARKDQFTQVANRDIEYVMFEVVPSAADIADTRASFESLYADFATAENLRNFVALNSDARYSDHFYGKTDLESVSAEFADLAFPQKGAEVKTVSDIYEGDGFFSAARVTGRKMMADSVSINYMLLPLTAEAETDSLLALLNANGVVEGMQELGWMTQEFAENAGVSEFNAAFDTNVGKSIKVKISSMQAYALIQTVDKTKPVEKVSLAVLTKNVNASDETYRDYLMQATELSDKSNGKYSEFSKIVSEESQPVIPVTHITEATRRIGVAENAREVVRWAFEAKEGEVSDVITVDNKYYFVVALTKARKAGLVDINEVKSNIKIELAMEKQGQKYAAEMVEKTKGMKSLDEMAEALNITVSHENGVSFLNSGTMLDPKFVGAIAGAKKGEVCGPVVGEIAVYMFEVTDTQSGAYFTEADATNSALQYASYRLQQLQSVLEKQAKVEDNRARFF
ncbi:MAG: SurA N-terminal domain-containing protein [Bacteroidales bacterium]|nr:SurA N-terminal domain-containing protein [Bacteroidales bacterium]